MGFPEYATDDPLAMDVEKAAFEVFPLLIGAENRFLREQYATAFANILGNSGEFHRYVTGSPGDRLVRINTLFKAFRDNAGLLVSKTWVEDHDLARKEAVGTDLASFVMDFQNGDAAKALPRFVALARGIAHLLFGHQSNAKDFIEYVFRIDPKLGLFFWYVEELGRLDSNAAEELKILLLILGVYFIASF